MLDDNKYKVLLEEVRGARSEIAVVDRDLANDRKDIGDFKVEMAGLKEEIKQLRSMLISNAQGVGDKVEDALGPTMQEVKLLKTEIKKKKSLVIKDKFDLPGFLKFKLASWRAAMQS